MSTFDIMPWVHGQGGTPRVYTWEMGTGTTDNTEDTSWRKGEVLLLDQTNGEVQYETDADQVQVDGGLHYIAAARSEDLIQAFNSTSGAADHNVKVPAWAANAKDTEWVTRNVSDNADANIGPGGTGAMTGVNVGDDVDFRVDDSTYTATRDGPHHTWAIDISPAAGTGFYIISRIIDEIGEDTYVSGAAADKVIFTRLLDV